MAEISTSLKVATYCPLCVSRCGAQATVSNGTFTLDRDPSHPTGKVLCIKGKEAPAITAHPDRLRHPLKRTTAKGSSDPGWQQITWDEALDTVAERLRALADEHGPESVVFSSVSPSTSAIIDCVEWIQRLQRAFGTPNFLASMELCGWGRYLASVYTYGASVPGQYMPDLERSECILFWGYNPAVSRLAHATATRAALSRGARLIVVDPRRAGLASKADPWLRVRPGTDAALALAITNVMIERGWYDEAFVRRWTSGPLLVRADTGRFLRASDHTDPRLAHPRTGRFSTETGDSAGIALSCGQLDTGVGGPLGAVDAIDDWSGMAPLSQELSQVRRSFPFEEQAQRVTGGVEHDTNAVPIPIGWLPWCLSATQLHCECNGRLQIVDLHLEVEHLRRLAGLVRPHRWLVAGIALDVQVDAPGRIEQLGPPASRAEVTNLEPKQPLVEPRHRLRPFAVNCDPHQLDHGGSLSWAATERLGPDGPCAAPASTVELVHDMPGTET